MAHRPDQRVAHNAITDRVRPVSLRRDYRVLDLGRDAARRSVLQPGYGADVMRGWLASILPVHGLVEPPTADVVTSAFDPAVWSRSVPGRWTRPEEALMPGLEPAFGSGRPRPSPIGGPVRARTGQLTSSARSFFVDGEAERARLGLVELIGTGTRPWHPQVRDKRRSPGRRAPPIGHQLASRTARLCSWCRPSGLRHWTT